MRALKGRHEFRVFAAALEAAVLHEFMHSIPVDVVLIDGNHLPNLSILRWLRVSHPKVAPVMLVESDDRSLVVNAFRAGARGIFLFNHTPFRLLCICITSVSQGQIWINSQQTQFLLDALSEVPTLRVVNANGRLLLTPREEQVLRMRFGIGEKSDHTLEEVGQKFTVTRERIRQIEAKALRKLRHPSRSKRLKSFMES